MNPFEFVLIIIGMSFLAAIIIKKMELGHGRGRRQRGLNHPFEQPTGKESAETLRLRQEVAELKERLKVLERITVDKENSLSRQIDELRDR
ncbi:hypothetical protein G7077_12960 [Sphingomonas piscis]|uniref:Uncharacterized protein n=1 Tax=Sphingomonas piscis TaxID=2714943 RepID=A0A6G7YSG4_9SPHN|nr:hypothetical protein [Sphingomonas piscis]QIK79680.1 hypothetical protein G7077_12960 [Sphingomonas piscis]